MYQYQTAAARCARWQLANLCRRAETTAARRAATATACPTGAFSTGVPVDWGLSQRPARVDWGLSYTTGQATIPRSMIVACDPEIWSLQNLLCGWLPLLTLTTDSLLNFTRSSSTSGLLGEQTQLPIHRLYDDSTQQYVYSHELHVQFHLEFTEDCCDISLCCKISQDFQLQEKNGIQRLTTLITYKKLHK